MSILTQLLNLYELKFINFNTFLNVYLFFERERERESARAQVGEGLREGTEAGSRHKAWPEVGLKLMNHEVMT